MTRYFVASLLLLASSVAAQAPPDLGVAPGVANPNVTQANIDKTICVVGWTATVRPPVSYTAALEKQQMLQDGDTVPQVPRLDVFLNGKNYVDTSRCVPHSSDPRCYEEDHAIALENGGHPTDPNNLRPQVIADAHKKDKLETRLKRMICSRKILLVDARACISKNWKTCYKQVFGVAP